MATVFGWIALLFALWFGSGILVGAMRQNIKVAKWAIGAFIVCAALAALLI